LTLIFIFILLLLRGRGGGGMDTWIGDVGEQGAEENIWAAEEVIGD
jgi:hypothetical protein